MTQVQMLVPNDMYLPCHADKQTVFTSHPFSKGQLRSDILKHQEGQFSRKKEQFGCKHGVSRSQEYFLGYTSSSEV